MDVVSCVVAVLLRILGILLFAVASAHVYFAMRFRLEGTDELKMIEQVDFELGAAFALALLLSFAPNCRWNPRAWLLALIGAAVIWMSVSGLLIWSHREQDRIRSSLSLLQTGGMNSREAEKGIFKITNAEEEKRGRESFRSRSPKRLPTPLPCPFPALAYRCQGRDFRLTEFHDKVVEELLA